MPPFVPVAVLIQLLTGCTPAKPTPDTANSIAILARNIESGESDSQLVLKQLSRTWNLEPCLRSQCRGPTGSKFTRRRTEHIQSRNQPTSQPAPRQSRPASQAKAKQPSSQTGISKQAESAGAARIKMLQQEVFALRYGENAAKLRSLALEGASRAELAQVRASMLQRDALERNKQAILDAAEAEKQRRDNVTRSAQALTESVTPPAEIFRGKVREIYKLSQQQAISAETEKRALTAARQEFMQNSGATSSAPSSPQHAQALFDPSSRQQFFSRLQERAAEMQKQQQTRQQADAIQKQEGRNAIQQAAQGGRRGKGDDRDLVRRDTQRNSLLKQIADRLEKNEEEPQGKVSIR